MSSSMTGSRGPTGLSSGQTMTGGNVIPKGYQRGQLNQFTPEQMNLFQSLFGQTGQDSFLSKIAGGDEGAFAQAEAPAMRQFQGLQGNIASRFSGMGMGGRRSSGFQNTMNSAAGNFAQDLQSQRMGLQSNALQQLMQMSQMLLGQRPQEQFLTKKELPFWKQLALGVNQQGQEMAQSAGNFALGMM